MSVRRLGYVGKIERGGKGGRVLETERDDSLDRPGLLMASVDTLPQPYEGLGLVHASTVVAGGEFSTVALLDMLESEASALGADGVIGIWLSEAVLPSASRARLVGQVADHASRVAATALGTAVRWLPATDGHSRGKAIALRPRECCPVRCRW
jgi:hypothetical protein